MSPLYKPASSYCRKAPAKKRVKAIKEEIKTEIIIVEDADAETFIETDGMIAAAYWEQPRTVNGGSALESGQTVCEGSAANCGTVFASSPPGSNCEEALANAHKETDADVVGSGESLGGADVMQRKAGLRSSNARYDSYDYEEERLVIVEDSDEDL